MKLFKKIVIFTLCLSLLVAIFVACGNDESPEETSQSKTDNLDSTAETTEKEVYTGNPIDDDPSNGKSESSDSGSSEHEPESSDSAPVDEKYENGFTGGGMELPGVTP